MMRCYDEAKFHRLLSKIFACICIAELALAYYTKNIALGFVAIMTGVLAWLLYRSYVLYVEKMNKEKTIAEGVK